MISKLNGLGLLLVAALGFSCGSDSGDGGTNPGDNPAIAIAISVSNLTITQGESGSLTATITRSGGFTGAVNITTTGAPAGVTATASNVTTTNGTTTGTILVSVDAGVAPGNYALTITATGSGVTDKVATLTLTVVGIPAIAITATPSLATVLRGTNTSIAIGITRTNYTGTVNFTVEGAPPGVAATFNPAGTTGTGTTLTITTDLSVVPGNYTLTVHATGTGITEQTTPVALTITADSQTPAIALTANPANLTLTQGTAGSLAVTIGRTNYTGAVTLSATGLPAGVTVAFSPNNTTANSANLEVTVSGAATPGTYTVTIHGTGTGITEATTPLALTVAAIPGFAIASIAPDPVTIAQGAQNSVTVTLARTNFAGTINLTVDAPAGITGSFSPAAATANSSTLTLTVGSGVTAADYTLTVHGTATGATAQSKTFVVHVVPAVTGSYTLTTTPALQASVQQGSSTDVTVNVNRIGGFVGTVSLAVTGTASGLTASLNPASVTGSSATLSLTASGGATIGSVFNLTVTGTTPGLANQTTTLQVTIAAPGGGGNVSLDFSSCDAEDRPIWLAYQDGTAGTWTRVVGAANVYTFNISQPKGGVAFVKSSGVGSYGISVQYYSQAEFLGISAATFCTASAATKTLTATVAGVTPATHQANLSLGGGSGIAFLPGTINLAGVQNGTFALFGYRHSLGVVGASDLVVVRRNINTAVLGAGASIGSTVDFGVEGVAPAAATISVTNIQGGETVVHGVQYYNGASCLPATLYFGMPASSSFAAYGIPAAAQVAGEAHAISLIATVGQTTRSLFTYLGALADRTLTLPSPLPVFTPTIPAGPYKRLRWDFTVPADVASSVSGGYADTGGQKLVTIGASVAGYFGGTAISLEMPDFSSVAGWENSWAPTAGALVNWTAVGAGAAALGPCVASGSLATSSRSGMN
ncbi:MAG: beta strand repeat-containing protein [Gemmatimonadales bacterium]